MAFRVTEPPAFSGTSACVAGVWSANRKLRSFLEVGSESPMMQELLRTIRCRLPRIADGVLVRRAFALAAAILFALSWIFPVGAGLVSNPTIFPRWWRTVDVALAFVVAVAALGIQGLAYGNVGKQAERTTYRIYRSLMHAILAVGVVVMLAGDRINWANCATGFLWRTWLLLCILPWWLAAARRTEIAHFDAEPQQQG